MSNYKESKEKLKKIRKRYSCKGDFIFRTAIQLLVDAGKCTILDSAWWQREMDDIDARHDKAEAEGKFLFMTRDFEKAIYECAKDLCEIDTYDILRYIQKEIWLGGEVGEPDYQRAMQIIRDCLCYTASNFGAYPCESYVTLKDFRNMGLTDEEIEYFGWSYLFDVEEDDEKR